LVAITRTQRAAQIAERVNEPELKGAAAGPVLPGEQGFFWAVELAPSRLHEPDEVLMDILLQRLEPLDILGLFRQERIEHRLALTGSIEPPLDAQFVQQSVEAKRAP